MSRGAAGTGEITVEIPNELVGELARGKRHKLINSRYTRDFPTH